MATYTGGTTDDSYTGTDAADTINGNEGNDILAGAGGGDTINGGDGSDTLYSAGVSPAWNQPYGGNPWTAPVLDTGSEVDTLNGGAGYDVIYAGYGDKVDGGADYARLLISFQGATAGVTADFSVFDTHGQLTIGAGVIKNISSVGWVEGSNFGDTIKAGNSSDGWFAPMFGMGGNDTLIAGYYSGDLFGGTGNDTLDARNGSYGPKTYGEAGDDVIYNGTTYGNSWGGDGNDIINGSYNTWGGEGNDTLNAGYPGYNPSYFGGNGDDVINGSDWGDSRLVGNAGADIIYGNGDSDQLFSGVADNVMNFSPYEWAAADTGLEHDRLYGGGWDDLVSIGYGDDADGGTETDTLILSLGGAAAGVTLNTAAIVSGGTFSLGGGTIRNFERVGGIFGSAFGDNITIAEQAASAIVHGGDGNDVLTIASSNGGELFGEAGDDTLNGGNGADTLHDSAGKDVMKGGGGDDIIVVDAVTDVVAGETINGGNGYDTLRIANTADQADISCAALSGIEAIIAGDTSSYGRVRLTAAQFDGLSSASGGFQLTTGGSVTLAGMTTPYFFTLDLSAAGNTVDMAGAPQYATVRGNNGNDVVIGGTQNDSILGGGGDDQLRGGEGADSLTGGIGVDIVKGEGGNDQLIVDAATDLAAGDVFDGGAGYDTLYFGYGVQWDRIDLSNVTVTGVEELSGSAYAPVAMTRAQLTGFSVLNVSVEITDGGSIAMAGIRSNSGTFKLSAAGNVFDLTGALGGASGNIFFVNGDAGNDVITGGEYGGDQIHGGGGNDQLNGAGGDDSLWGDAGNDTFFSSAGNDVYYGGTGDDFYYVDQGDQVFEYAGEGIDTVSTTQVGYTLGSNVENLLYSLAGTQAFAGTGNSLDNQIFAQDGADTLKGMAGNDVLQGMGGNDRLEGGEGDDTLVGGAGKDTMIGGTGNDSYYVDSTGDVVTELAGEGTDTVLINGGLVAYTLGANVENLRFQGTGDFAGTGNADANVISTVGASGGNDTLKGMAGDDTLNGGAGNDMLDGGTGNDIMIGGTGDDTYVVDAAGDVVTEFAGEGTDTVRSSVSFVLAGDIENLTATGGASIALTGNALANVLTGNGGHNILDGRAGADTMAGGGGDDTYYVDNAGDVIVEAAGEGTDTVRASLSYTLKAGVAVEALLTDNDAGTAAINLTGNELANRIVGNAGNNSLSGGGGDDRLEGGDGSDTLTGGTGADKLIGGAGNDVYVVSDLLDTVTELAGGGTDSVSLTLATGGSYTLANEVERLVVYGANTQAHGNALDNVITDGGTGNSLYGEAGNDTLNGNANAETFHGGIGNDTIKSGAGNDLIFGEAGNDLFVFATGTGADEIGDFAHGSDRIDLSAFGISSFSLLQTMMSQSGANGVIDLGGGDKIVLDGVTMSTLTATDFVLATPGTAHLALVPVDALLHQL